MLFDVSKYAKFITNVLNIYISLLQHQRKTRPHGEFAENPVVSEATKKLMYDNINKQSVPPEGILLIEVINCDQSQDVRQLCQSVTGERCPVKPLKNETIMLPVYYHIFIASVQEIKEFIPDDCDIPPEIHCFITKIEKLRLIQSLHEIKLNGMSGFSKLSQFLSDSNKTATKEEEISPVGLDTLQISRTQQWKNYIAKRIPRLQSPVYLVEFLLVVYECVYKEYIPDFHMFMLHVFRRGNIHRFVFGRECVLGDSAKFSLSNWVEAQLINAPKTFTESINYITSICQQIHDKCPKTNQYNADIVKYAFRIFVEWMNDPNDPFSLSIARKLPAMLDATDNLRHFSTVEEAITAYSSGNDSWEMFRVKLVPLEKYVSSCSPEKFIEIETCLWALGTTAEIHRYTVVKIVCHAASRNLYDSDFSLYSMLKECGVKNIKKKVYTISPKKFLVLTEFVPTLQYLSMCCALRTDTISTPGVLCTPYLCRLIEERCIKSTTHIDLCVAGDTNNEFFSSTMKIDHPDPAIPGTEVSSQVRGYSELKLRALFEVMCSCISFKCKLKENLYYPAIHSELHIWAGVISVYLSIGRTPTGPPNKDIICGLVAEGFSILGQTGKPGTQRTIFGEWEKVLFVTDPHVISLRFNKENAASSRKILRIIPKDLALHLITSHLHICQQPAKNGFSDPGHVYEYLVSHEKPKKGTNHFKDWHIRLPLQTDQLIRLLEIVLEKARDEMARPRSAHVLLFGAISVESTNVDLYKRTRSKSMDKVLLHHATPTNFTQFGSFSREYFSRDNATSDAQKASKPRHCIKTSSVPSSRVASSFKPMNPSQVEKIRELSSIGTEKLEFHSQSDQRHAKSVDCAVTYNVLEGSHILEYYSRFFMTMLCFEYSRTLRNKTEFAKHIHKLQQVQVFNQNIQNISDLIVHSDPTQQIQIRGHEFVFMLDLKVNFPTHPTNDTDMKDHNPVPQSPVNEMFEFKTRRLEPRVVTIKLRRSQAPKDPFHVNNLFSHLLKYNLSLAKIVTSPVQTRELASIVTVAECLRRINHPSDMVVAQAHHTNALNSLYDIHLCAPLLRGISAEKDITFHMALRNLLNAYVDQLNRLGNSRITSSLTILPEESRQHDEALRKYTSVRLREFSKISTQRKSGTFDGQPSAAFSVEAIDSVLEFPREWVKRNAQIMYNTSREKPTILGGLAQIPLLHDGVFFDSACQLTTCTKIN